MKFLLLTATIILNVNRVDKLQSEMAALRTSNSLLQDEYRQKLEQMTKNNIELKALKSERGKMVQVTSYSFE
jgi:hypothetical protein